MGHRVPRPEADVRQDVINALRADPVIATAPIDATVHDAIVSVRGQVWSRNEKIAATAAAASVAGVRGVIAEIEIRQPTPKATSDTAVTIRVSRALEQHPFVPRGSITVTVDHGDVTLRGVVAFEHQRRAAEHALLDLAGVRKIINHILVESEHVTGAAVASAIAETLAVSDERGERSIDITFDRGTVMLRGTVPNWAASRHAEAAARTVSGVRRVINLLIIRD